MSVFVNLIHESAAPRRERRVIKPVCLLLLLAVILFGCASAIADSETVAALYFTNSDGTQAYWGADTAVAKGTTALITGEGRYKVSVTFAKKIRNIQFCNVVITNGEKAYPRCTIEVNSILIDGKSVKFSKGFTCSDDRKTTSCILWNTWFEGMSYDLNPRSHDGVISDAGLMLKDQDFIGAKKIEVEFTFRPNPKKQDMVASICFSNEDGSQAYWGFDSDAATGQTAKVKGPGRYQVSTTFKNPIQNVQLAYLSVTNAEAQMPGCTIEVTSVLIDGRKVNPSRGFTYSQNGKDVFTPLWEMWSGGAVSTDFRPRVHGAAYWDAGFVLQKKDLIGAKKIEVEFVLRRARSDRSLTQELKARGMDTNWNVMVLICRKATVKGHAGSFSNQDVNTIRKKIIPYIKPTVDGLARGRMTIGTVETMVIDRPVKTLDELNYPTYGPGGSLDFDDLVKGKDVNLVIVFMPVKDVGWLGLGGTFVSYGNQKVYVVSICTTLVEGGEEVWKIKDTTCPHPLAAVIHEILHCVETNSRDNGYSAFTHLHSNIENMYQNSRYENFDWYIDLMRDTIADGTSGFHLSSYYVTHYGVK